jgi:hypothetical protein
MMENDFSFPCGHAAQSDALFERFLDADPQNISDPFPEIARRQNFSQYRSQPFSRIYYWASPDPLNDVMKLRHGLKYGHEMGHLNNDDTPAKCWARYLHGSRIQRVNTILWADTWDTEVANSWLSLQKINELISAVISRIRLSEELLATAESFVKMEVVVNSIPGFAHWRRKSGYLEEEAFEFFEAEEQRQLFPDYRTFYPAIKKVMTWAYKSSSLGAKLRIFLQGLHIKGEPNTWTVDSHQQCLLLAEQVKGMDNPAKLSDWLIEMIRQQDLYLGGEVFDHMLAEDGKGTVAEALWQITHRGPNSPDGLYGPLPKKVPFIFNNYLFDPSRLSISIFPRFLDTKWYIQPVVLRNYGDYSRVETNKYLELEPVMVVLKLEAILEQLLWRDGICCPYYYYRPDIPSPCPCQPEWKRALKRLLRWGREGKFGPGGTWRDLSPACSC